MIHEQVQKQLDFWYTLVHYEEERERFYKINGYKYIPSRRKYEDLYQFNAYKKEIEENGDRNLLVRVRINDPSINMYGVYSFAVRETGNKNRLVHRTKYGTEILISSDDGEIVD